MRGCAACVAVEPVLFTAVCQNVLCCVLECLQLCVTDDNQSVLCCVWLGTGQAHGGNYGGDVETDMFGGRALDDDALYQVSERGGQGGPCAVLCRVELLHG